MSKVAWIGLGIMGYPMAGHLATLRQHEVAVFNRTRAKADAWVARFGGRAAATPPKRRKGRTSSLPAWAMTTTSAR